MAIAQTEPNTKSSYKSAMNQKDQLNSIQALKDAYRQKASTNRDEKFQIQIEKEKKPHSSVFSGQMNKEFLKQTPTKDEDIQILAANKPADFEEQLELQREDEERYQRFREEEERRYEGLTALQKKKLILQELEEAQNGGGDKGKKATERSKWAPAQPKPAKESKKDKLEIINNDVVIKVASRVPDEEDEEADEIQPPK